MGSSYICTIDTSNFPPNRMSRTLEQTSQTLESLINPCLWSFNLTQTIPLPSIFRPGHLNQGQKGRIPKRPIPKRPNTEKAHTRQAQKSYHFTCVYHKLSYNWQNADATLFILSVSILFLQTYCKGFPHFKYISCQSISVGTNEHVWERQIANELEKWIYLNINRINKNKQAMTVKQIIQKYKTLHLKKLKDHIYYLHFLKYIQTYNDET